MLICGIGLGFIPGYAFSWLLKKFNLLRVSAEVEEKGLDLSELGIEAYPEKATVFTASQSSEAPAMKKTELTPSTEKGAYGQPI